MSGRESQMAEALILFGVTGDLARRRLLPALYEMADHDGVFIPIIGVSRREWDDEQLRDNAREAIETAGITLDESVFAKFASNLTYVRGEYQDAATFEAVRSKVGDGVCTVSYLAIPPGLFDDVISCLAAAGLHHQGRVVVEKPFGRDTASARELNEIIYRHFPEERVYRIDHFLGKEALQNLMVFRFSNAILEPIWNRHYIRGVQINMMEDYGVQGRGAFYDTVGAMRDVVQNHLLVLMSLLAMEPPVSDSPNALRDERVKVLEATKPIDPTDVVFGQYSGYADEPGVAADSLTETFFAARVEIDSWRWAGVPWVIRAGKGLGTTVTEAAVEFLRPPRLFFGDEDAPPGPNRILFQSKPNDRIVVSMQAKRPGPEIVSEPVSLALDYQDHPGEAQGAYRRLLRDAIRGDQALFARVDGVMEAWRIVQPVLDASLEPEPYQRGSAGPVAADRLVDLLGWEWLTR